MTGAVTVRRLGPEDARAFRELRLEAVARHPDAFGGSWDEEAAQPDAWFAERLAESAVFAADTDGELLTGMVGLMIPNAVKLRHKGVVWGMYVRAPARGTGLGAALLARSIAHARGLVEEIRLCVVTTNEPALRLYRAAGFEAYGLERRALRVEGRDHDELLMSLSLTPPAG